MVAAVNNPRRNKHMKTTVNFFKQDGCWYADVAGHTLADNQMVAGSDEFLEAVDSFTNADGKVDITLSDNNVDGAFLAKLVMRSHNQWGATYVLAGPMAEQYNAAGFELWICNVTHDVLGEHPRSIYIHEIA